MASAIHPSRALHPNPTKVRPSHTIAYLPVIGLSTFLARRTVQKELQVRRGAAEIGSLRPQLSQEAHPLPIGGLQRGPIDGQPPSNAFADAPQLWHFVACQSA